jgi:hypothetical protein
LRLIEWGISAERTPLEKIVRKAIDIENSEEAHRREMRSSKVTNASPPERKWGRFANRTNGTQPYRPDNGEGGSRPRERTGRVRVNAMTPQPQTERPRPQNEGRRKQGRKLSRAKRDELRAAGKCFQCEETGHGQRDCPKLNSMRRPAVTVNNVDLARLERLSSARGFADIRVGSMAFGGEGAMQGATGPERRVYRLCATEWGRDDTQGA